MEAKDNTHTHACWDVSNQALLHIDYLTRKIKDSTLAALEYYNCVQSMRSICMTSAEKEKSFMEAAYNAAIAGTYQSFEEFYLKFMLGQETEVEHE